MDLGKVKLLITNEHWKKKIIVKKHILNIWNISKFFSNLFEAQYSMNPKIQIANHQKNKFKTSFVPKQSNIWTNWQHGSTQEQKSLVINNGKQRIVSKDWWN
jgi:hypothetical protein